MARQIVSNKLLGKIRRLNLRIMPDSATVLRGEQAADGRGGVTMTWTEAAAYECRFRPAADFERQHLMGDQAVADPLFVAVLPYNSDVNEADRLRINGVDYEITGWLGNRTYKVGARVALSEVTPETAEDNE